QSEALSCYGRLSAGDDVEDDLRLDLGVEADQGGVLADRLDRGGNLDLAAVQLRAAGVLDGRGDVGGGDRTEEASLLAGVRLDGHRGLLERALELLGLLEGLDLAGLATLGDRVDLLLTTLGPAGRQTTGDEVVAGVPGLDVDDVARGAEAGDLVGENDLHVSVLPAFSRSVELEFAQREELE